MDPYNVVFALYNVMAFMIMSIFPIIVIVFVITRIAKFIHRSFITITK